MNNFKFDLGVSTKNFNQKPKRYDIIQFNKKSLTIQELYEYILNGCMYTNNFSNLCSFKVKDKCNDNFSYTNTINLDFDKCPFDYNTVLSNTIIKPNISYTTFSNKTDIDNRFRFVYITDEPIQSVEEYKGISILILNIIFKPEFLEGVIQSVDKASFKASQMFLGTNQNSLNQFQTQSIITVELLNLLINDELNTLNDFNNKYGVELFERCFGFSTLEYTKKKIIISQNKKSKAPTIDIALKIRHSDSFVPQTNNFHRAIHSEDSEDIYSYVNDQDIYSLSLYAGKDNERKIKKGKRSKSLLVQSQILYNINPSITLEEMIATLIWIRDTYFDSPKEIKYDEIYYTAKKIMEQDSVNTKLGKRKYLIKPEFNGLGKEEKIKFLGLAKRKRRNQYVGLTYDSNVNVKQNAIESGVSSSTIYNFMKDAGITKTNIEFENFKNVYNSTPESERSVRKLASKLDIHPSKAYRFIKKILNMEIIAK